MKVNVMLWLFSSAEADLVSLQRFKMELLTRIDNGFRFDALFAFLKEFWSFEFLFAQMGFSLIKKVIKIPKGIRGILEPSKAFQMKLFIKTVYYLSSSI